ncbi:glycosyltransferase family 4 protein [Rhizobium sp. Leaf341]|uniref:glycosyltransferase family 4 protein n=1 Tax=Rhizobium sp. Leaf341 TaxID=1736344 RepID=UPI000714EC5A|nr:glycosyltransferase family 4 protein [Rhizobium sp. Leaf341]KQR73279.1 hypothetical protein ASG03_00115 [Rhizobium sp. Leaf341]
MLKFLMMLTDRVRAAKAGKAARPRIWMIGPMPLPLNGQSNYNATIARFFEAQAPTTVLPTGGTGAEKIVAGLLLPFIILFCVRRDDHVYTSPPGQNGVWLFLPVIAALRLRNLDHIVHHHSFRPINLGPTRASRILCRLGGRFQRHVFLSAKMRDKYAALYLTDLQKSRSFVLPNAFFFYDEKGRLAQRQGPVTIGHLSVITREKGVDYLLQLVERLLTLRTDFRFCLAGPVADAALHQEIVAFCQRHPAIATYLGSVQGDAKARFYEDVDIFILPTRLVDEADPLVILEAYSYGSEILASSTGCIPERMRLPSMLISFELEQDVQLLDRAITDVAAQRTRISQACVQHVKAMHETSRSDARTFFASLGLSIPDQTEETSL